MREDLPEIAHAIASTPGIQAVRLTSNGVRLAGCANQLEQAGITSINVSLDSLDSRAYERITGTNALAAALDGLHAALPEVVYCLRLNADCPQPRCRGHNWGGARALPGGKTAFSFANGRQPASYFYVLNRGLMDMPPVPTAPNSELISVDEAVQTIIDTVPRTVSETVPLSATLGRVLARDICATCSLPAFDNSAMDGYALRSRDSAGATRETPVALTVRGEQPAGVDRELAADVGLAVKIMTGAPMPLGADSVVILEEVSLSGDCIELCREVSCGDNVRCAGEDVTQGELVLRAGQRLGAAEMGVLAALGVGEVSVCRRPQVAVITTGSELVGVDDMPVRGQIRDINYHTLPAQITQSGCEISYLARIADEENDLAGAIREATDVSDVIITSGGVSVGDYDLVKETLASLGRILFGGVAIKPGKPLAYGHIGTCPVFGLPGNPVSSMVAFDVFVRPALLAMEGTKEQAHVAVSGVLDGDIRHKKGRREFVRAVTRWSNGGYCATPTGDQGSARMSSVMGANSYIVVPEESGGVSSGETVTVVLWGCR